MSLKLHNTKIEYKSEVWLKDKSGLDTYYYLVDLANRYCMDDKANANNWWMGVDQEEALELSLPLAKAMLAEFKGADRQVWQGIIDEAVDWDDDYVRLELW